MDEPEPENDPKQDKWAVHRSWTSRLDRWAALSPRQTNTGLIAFTALMMVCLLGGTWDMPDRAAYLCGIALIFAGTHGLLHLLTLRGLRRLQTKGVAAAGRALAAYRDPRRVTHLDLVIGWMGYAALMSVLNWVSPGIG